MTAPHVLLIDDDPLVRDIVADFVAKLGGRATVCATGAQALAELTSVKENGGRFDLVLIDLRLATESGLDVCRRLRPVVGPTRMVCVSGDLMSSGWPAIEAAGFDGVLMKPLSFKAFEACVQVHAGRASDSKPE